jgi:type VI secretion system protein ImpK
MERREPETDTVNPLLESSAELIALVMPLRSGRLSAEVPDNYREQVMHGFQTLERKARERQLSDQMVTDAKYALAAFVDESVMASEWPGRTEWMRHPLQLEMFGEHLAGEGFFRRLSELRQGGEANADILELYYVCLQLGFEGMYRVQGLEQLMALTSDLRNQIHDYRGSTETRLAVYGTPPNGFFQRVGRHLPYWVIASVTAALMLGGYSGYVALNEAASNRTLATVQTATEAMPRSTPAIELNSAGDNQDGIN